MSTSKRTARPNVAAGIWEIIDMQTGERISKFRARRKADVERALKMAELGLKRPASDFEARYITDWETNEPANG